MIIAIVAVAAAAAGCTGSQPRPSAAAKRSAHLTPVWHVTQEPFIEPTVVNGILVLGTVSRGVPQLEALDPKTGRVLWSRATSPSFLARGVALDYGVVGSNVTYLAPVAPLGQFKARVTIADARTGRVLAASPPEQVSAPPYACADGSGDVCLSIAPAPYQVRFGIGDSNVRADPTAVRDAYSIAPGGIVFTLSSNPSRIGLARKGKLVWSATSTSLFGSGASPSRGWILESDNAAGVIYGSVGTESVDTSGSTFVVDLDTRWSEGAFRAGTGKPLWRAPGWMLGCNTSMTGSVPNGGDPHLPPISCRITGTDARRTSDGKLISANLTTATMRRYNPVTGATLWSTPIADMRELDDGTTANGEPAIGYLDADHLLIRGAEPQVIDLGTGAIRPTTATDRGWCTTSQTAQYPLPIYYDNQPDRELAGTNVWSACTTASGHATALPATVPSNVGMTVDGLSIVLEPGGISAYRG